MLSGLQMKDGRWHLTHFVFHFLDPTLLPVVDIYNLPETNPGSHYHLEIGPVCFLWEFSLSHLCIEGSIILNDTVSHPWRSEQWPPVGPPSRKIQFCSANLPLDCRHGEGMQGRWDADGLWWRQGLLALIAFQTAKASSCFSRRISMCMPAWGRKRLHAKQFLWNIINWKETKAKLSVDFRVTYFFNCIPFVRISYQEFCSRRRIKVFWIH